jgi:hypothetical protein
MTFLTEQTKPVAAQTRAQSVDAGGARSPEFLLSCYRGLQSGAEVVDCTAFRGSKPTGGVVDHDGLAVAVHAKLVSCQGKDGAPPAASPGEDIHLRARDVGNEAVDALKIVGGETGGRREGEDEAASHHLVPKFLYQIYVTKRCTFNP